MATPVPIRGLFETHLRVRDLPRAVDFYREAVGLPLALDVPDRQAAFFWVGRAGQALRGLWSLGSAPLALSLHSAFEVEVPLDALLEAPGQLEAQGVTPLSFFGEPATPCP